MEAKLSDVAILDIPVIKDPRGSLSVIEDGVLPFSVERVFYLFDVPYESYRGGHAHHELQQFMVAINGSFDVLLDDGAQKRQITLNRPDKGLLIPPGIWREMLNFSSGSVCLVLASLPFSEDDYIRDYDEFLKLKNVH